MTSSVAPHSTAIWAAIESELTAQDFGNRVALSFDSAIRSISAGEITNKGELLIAAD